MTGSVAFDPDLSDPLNRWLIRIDEHSQRLPDLQSVDPIIRRVAMRHLSDLLTVEFTSPAPDSVSISDAVVSRPDGSGLRLRRYVPDRLRAPYPTQLWCHGGGFFFGAVDELINDRLCAARAEQVGIQILSVDYRLAPEHPYPAGVLDVLTAYDVAHHDPTLEVDHDRLGLGGNSAGAFLAASAVLRLRDSGQPVLHQALEVPMITFEISGDPSEDYASEAHRDFLEMIKQKFLPRPDAYAELLRRQDLAGLPPTLIMTAEYDPLRDSAERYAARLEAAGVPVTTIREPGHLHSSCGLTAASDRARTWQQHAEDAIRTGYRTAGDRQPSAT